MTTRIKLERERERERESAGGLVASLEATSKPS